MKGRWWEITEEVKEVVNSAGFQQKWVLDPKGYFLIRINREEKTIEVGHCTNEHKLIRVITGKKPEEIMYQVIDRGCISLLDHAAYLGKELQKAYFALTTGGDYVQDAEASTKSLSR